MLAFGPTRVSFASADQPAVVDPTALVRRATEHRFDASRTHQPLRYLLRKTDGYRQHQGHYRNQGWSCCSPVANGQPLDPQANQTELDRLNTLANHPEIQEHRRQRENKDEDRVNRLMRLLPDAFLYRLEGLVPAELGNAIA